MYLGSQNKDLVIMIQQALELGGPSQAAEACAQALMHLRSLDQPGARAVVAADAQLGLLLAEASDALKMVHRLEVLAASRECLACATCCRVSSPTLYREDLELINPAGLSRKNLYTLRPGQKAYSARLHKSIILGSELIKVREDQNRACVFLTSNHCGIYEERPMQCRHLECWSGRHGGDLEDRPRLTRLDLFAGQEEALALMAEYEAKLPVAGFIKALQGAAGGDQDQEAQALAGLEMDHRLRLGAAKRYGYSPADLDLLWGLPLRELAHLEGLVPQLDDQGRPRLTKLDSRNN